MNFNQLLKFLRANNIAFEESSSQFKIPDYNGMTYRYNGSLEGREIWAKELIEKLQIK